MPRTPVQSLPVNDPTASHRVVGKSEKYGSGILGYYTRFMVDYALEAFREADPTAEVRVEPHHPDLMGKALRSTDVEWVINSDGELGVKLGDQFFFMYKGESLMYTNEGGKAPSQYRRVEKREFGESGPKAPEGFLEVGDWRDLDYRYSNNEHAHTGGES